MPWWLTTNDKGEQVEKWIATEGVTNDAQYGPTSSPSVEDIGTVNLSSITSLDGRPWWERNPDDVFPHHTQLASNPRSLIGKPISNGLVKDRYKFMLAPWRLRRGSLLTTPDASMGYQGILEAHGIKLWFF